MTRTAILIFALCLPACLEPQEVLDLPAGAVPVPSSQLAEIDPFATFGGIETRERGVIRDQADWTRVWTRLVRPFEPKPVPPAIDFTVDMVVVAAMGTRPTGGYGIRIDGVYSAGDRLYVVVEETSLDGGCIATQAITAPVTAVRVARSDLRVAFVNRSRRVTC
jgi:hypothetical protein